ncbi:condensin-2 complex subunit G2 [Arapaima gigas]
MSKRKAFLQSVCRDNVKDFLHFLKQHRDRTHPFELEEVLQEMSRDQRESLWAQLTSFLADTLVAYPIERWHGGLSNDSGDEMEVEGSPDLKNTMSVIAGITEVATFSIGVIQPNDSYDALLNCVNMLNDILGTLPVSEAQLQLLIVRLFESWWQKGLEGREALGWTAFLWCLKRTLLLKKPGPDINRLWDLHEVLLNIPFESEDGKEVTDLLLQCFLSVAHIRREEGRRFLNFLFSWNVNFIAMIHGTIKNQLQFFTKSVTDHVADIYFRAWKNASGVILEAKNTCIQDFMQHAVLLHRDSPVHPRVRQIMSYFHKQKLRQGVDEMLFQLYKPILWRGLKATNSEVRANAALLFTEAFPIQDPSLGSEKIDEAIQKQLDLLFLLLEDPQPVVRSTAVLGVCKILAKYWEVIPPAVLTDFLKKLVTDLAADITSPDVRCSVFKCMAVILDNNLSHPLLEQLLPALKNSLHDNSEKVRVSFVDLLLKLKATRAAKFWKVCSMEHLLARLEVDSRPISRRIVDLLFNSFFPINQSEEVWCERCVTLIQMNPAAARKFYQYAHAFTAPTNIAKLMLTIRRCLNACIQRDRAEDLNETDSSNKENSSVLEDVLSVQDMGTMASLLEVVAILWRSIRKSLDHNQEAQQYIFSKFAQVLPEYFRVFQDERCTAPLILMASFMPAAAVPTFSCGVLSKLRRLEVGTEPSQYTVLIDCLCSWGHIGHVLELITDWLNEALQQNVGRRDSERRVRIQETMDAKPELGLDYLKYMMSQTSLRSSLLELKRTALNQLLKALKAWRATVGFSSMLVSYQLVLYENMSSAESGCDQSQMETALKAFVSHGQLSILLHHKFSEGRGYLQGVENSMAWLEERALPLMLAPISRQWDLVKQVVEKCLTIGSEVVMVGLADKQFKERVLHLCSVILLSEGGDQCAPLLLSVLREVAQECLALSSQSHCPDLDVLLVVVANIFQKMLELMARKLRKEPDEGLQLCQAVSAALGDFLNVLHDWKAVSLEAINGVFSTLFAAIVVEIRHSILKVSCAEELTVPKTEQELPPLSCCLLGVILKSPQVTRFYLCEVSSSLESEAIEDVTGLAALLQMLAVVRHTGKFKSELKDIAVSVQRQLQKHHAVTAEDSRTMERVIYLSANKRPLVRIPSVDVCSVLPFPCNQLAFILLSGGFQKHVSNELPDNRHCADRRSMRCDVARRRGEGGSHSQLCAYDVTAGRRCRARVAVLSADSRRHGDTERAALAEHH